MNIKVNINVLNLIGTILALLVTISIMNGSAQTVVHFADPINEMACALMSMLLTIGLAITSFEKIK
jgi:hypothetical protein